MGLVGNGLALSANPGKLGGGGTVYTLQRSKWTEHGSMQGFGAGSATVIAGASIAATAARPNGYEAPYSWMLPRKGGGLSAYTTLRHPNTLTANLALGANIAASMANTGAITTANIQTLANLAASLVATTTVTTTMVGLASLAASLLESGNVTAALDTYALLVSTMQADGSITSASLALVVSLSTNMTANGSVSAAELTLLVQLAASMLASCAVTGAMVGKANLAASLAANGDLTGAISVLAYLITNMTSNGSLDGSVLRGTASMSADMTTAGSVDAPPTPAQIATAVWSFLLAGTAAGDRLGEVSAARMALLNQLDTTSPASAATQMILARKILNNRLEVDIASQSLVLYDDNGYTVLQRWPLKTTGGEAVTTGTGVQTKRGMPT